MKKREKINSKFNKYTLIIVIVMITIFCIETVGYAQISSLIKLGGSVTWNMDGKLLITNVTRTSMTNATENATPTFEGTQVSFNVTLNPQNNRSATVVYQVTLTNNSSFTHTFTNADIDNSFNNTNRVTTNVQVSGITQGQRIEPGTTATFTVTITGTRRNGGMGNNNSSSGTSTITINTNALSNGKLVANLDNTTGNLVNNNIEHFVINAMNTRPYGHTLTISTNADKIEIVNSSGNALGNLSIDASETKTLDYYVKLKDSAVFGKSPYKAGIILSSSDGTILSLGNISLTVPVAGGGVQDNDAPVISNVTASKNSTDGSITVTYDSSDDSAIATYYIQACKEENGSYNCSTAETATIKSYTFTGLSYGTYKFKVYAEDEWGNVATASEIASATTSSGHACESTSAFYRWKVNVTFSLSNMRYDGSNSQGTISIDYMSQYSFTLTPFDNYTLPDSITVSNTSGNLTQGTGYSYTQSSGAVVLYAAYVTEDITISGTATYNFCLVEGTRIKLSNGNYKNIEDITYTDLLSVWSYDTGSLTYEYPIWIEKSNESNSYQKTTFSDGTVLKTVGLHQVFSLDDNKFVNIIDENGFIKVGTRVAKEVNGKIVPVKVTKVETIKEKVKYYYVASSIYYNIISEDIITTSDQIVPGVTLSNMYGFDNNIKWPSIRKEIISKKGALYDYKDLKVMPYYLYYGSRGNETKLFVNMGYATTPELIDYLLRIQLNPEKSVDPITDKKGNRLWMVTTSDDKFINEKDFLYKEGSTYTLKQPNKVNNKEFIGWFNTVDNKMYKVGDKYKIIHGTHFIAIWK